jgi:SAM-dependent methyltransferase
MNSRRGKFVSCRRTLLDQCLEEIRPQLLGNVLEVGGCRVRRRGVFAPPYQQTTAWVTVNPDPNTLPDLLSSLPDLPFAPGTFDTVICMEVLEYIEDVSEAVGELARVLKPGGVAYASAPFLHREHGDYEKDRLRFTSKYLENVFGREFSYVRITPMGAMPAVLFDLLWPIVYKYSLLRVILRQIGHYVALSGSPTSVTTTGFFIMARK